MNVPLLGQKYILIWTELEGHFDYFPSSLRVTNIAYDNKLIIEIPIVKKSGRPDIVTLFQVPVREQKFVCMYVRMYVCMYVCMYLLSLQYRDHLYFRGIVIGTFTFCGT